MPKDFEASAADRRQRVCFTLQIKPDRVAEYRARHRDVWPEMATALDEAGWHNYSIFVRDDGLLIGYVETDDFSAAQVAMARTDINARWQDSVSEFFVRDDAHLSERADANMQPLPLVFHLDDRLAELDSDRHPTQAGSASTVGYPTNGKK